MNKSSLIQAHRTNDVTDGTRHSAIETFDNVLSSIHWMTKCRVIRGEGGLSGSTPRPENVHLNTRIDSLNEHLQQECDFIDHNATIKDIHRFLQRDGLHLLTSTWWR